MKTLALLTLFGDLCLSQIPTGTLSVQFDMVTITSGTTLVDQSGNGNNGTIAGSPVTTSKGITFDGSNDIITFPPTIGNSDFTVMIWAASNTTNKFMFSEAATTGSGIGMGTPAFTRILASNGAGPQFSIDVGAIGTADYHCYVLRRAGRTGQFYILDRPQFTQTKDVGAITITTDAASLGGRSFTGGPDLFWTGKIAYVLIYTSALPAENIAAAYNSVRTTLASRAVPMSDLIAPLSSAPVWNRKGVVVSADTPGTLIGEPTVIYDSGTWHMWYSQGTGLYYRSSTDGYTWPGAGTSIVASHLRSFAIKVGLTYYLYAANSGETAIDLYTATVASGPYTLNTAGVISLGTAGQWDDTGVFNSAVYKDGATWYLVYEGSGTGVSTFQCGGATSSDGITWTKVSANPISGWIAPGCSANQIYKIGSNWWLWHHATAPAGYGGSVLYRRMSSVFNSAWQLSPLTSTFLTGPPDEANQVADATYVEVNGKVYNFYTAIDAGGVTSHIKLAVANMPLAGLIVTAEGATSNVP